MFKPGAPSGNPGGRPKGLARRVQEATEHGKTVIDVLVEILTNEKAKNADRIKAGEILLDRGFGKALGVVLTADAGAGLPDGLSDAADALLERLARQLSSPLVRVLPAVAVKVPVSIEGERVDLPVIEGDPDK